MRPSVPPRLGLHGPGRETRQSALVDEMGATLRGRDWRGLSVRSRRPSSRCAARIRAVPGRALGVPGAGRRDPPRVRQDGRPRNRCPAHRVDDVARLRSRGVHRCSLGACHRGWSRGRIRRGGSC